MVPGFRSVDYPLVVFYVIYVRSIIVCTIIIIINILKMKNNKLNEKQLLPHII